MQGETIDRKGAKWYGESLGIQNPADGRMSWVRLMPLFGGFEVAIGLESPPSLCKFFPLWTTCEQMWDSSLGTDVGRWLPNFSAQNPSNQLNLMTSHAERRRIRQPLGHDRTWPVQTNLMI